MPDRCRRDGRGVAPMRAIEHDIPVWTVAKPSEFLLQRPRSWASHAGRCSVLQLMKALDEFRPDIIHVHFPCSQIGSLNWIMPLRRNWRLVATVHNSEIRCLPITDPGAMSQYRRFYGLVDAFTAVSRDLLDESVALFPSLRSKLRVIRNGVSDEWFDQIPRPRHAAMEGPALFVGRLEHVKGLDLLLVAWQQTHQRSRWNRLLVAGDGSQAMNYRRLAAELGIEESVTWLGRKRHDELRHLYRNVGIVLLPSRREGLPLTLLEACALRCDLYRVGHLGESRDRRARSHRIPHEARVLRLPREYHPPGERRIT